MFLRRKAREWGKHREREETLPSTRSLDFSNRKLVMKQSTIKHVFAGAFESINFTVAEQSGGQVRGKGGFVHGWKITGLLATAPLSPHVRNLLALWLLEPWRKFPRCLLYEHCFVIGWGSAGCQRRPLRELGRSLKKERKRKSILSSHAPLGAKATLGILKDAWVDRIWLPEVERWQTLSWERASLGPARPNLLSGSLARCCIEPVYLFQHRQGTTGIKKREK